MLETLNLIKRKVSSKESLKVEYSITDLGVSLKPIIDIMEIWGELKLYG